MTQSNYYRPGEVFHVVSCERVFHVVVLESGEGRHVAWCLEFPVITLTAATRDEAIRRISDRIDCVYRQQRDAQP